MLKKIVIFLIGCAVGYACWNAFIVQSPKTEPAENAITEEVADTTISEVKGIDELPEDTMKLDSVMPAK